MRIKAYKFQGAGNDFVAIDNREKPITLTPEQIIFLCHRRFGIGADGVLLLEKSNRNSFGMRYFNSDGSEGTMCGNGGRCTVAFANMMGIEKFEFEAIDGCHTAQIVKREGDSFIVRLKMKDVKECISYSPTAYLVDTGSPHYVEFIESDIENYPVDERGRYYRYHPDFKGGMNVNFVQIVPNMLKIRTYERGVEAETYACGTGSTATALAAYIYGVSPLSSEQCTIEAEGKNHTATKIVYRLKAVGGMLEVDAIYINKTLGFREIYLTGPAVCVFRTEIEI